MTDCCTVTTNDKTPPKTAVCPRNGRTYAGVERRTVLHHACQPWARTLTHQGYYFCDDADCDVVYFGEDQSLLIRGDLRGDVGQKSHRPDKTLCYCFDIHAADIQAERSLRAGAGVCHRADPQRDLRLCCPQSIRPVLPEGFPYQSSDNCLFEAVRYCPSALNSLARSSMPFLQIPISTAFHQCPLFCSQYHGLLRRDGCPLLWFPL